MSVWNDQGFDMANETPDAGHYVVKSINNGITLAGSNQATGTVLGANVNVISTGSVCVLPAGLAAGTVLDVINNGGTVVTPYPPSGGQINDYGTNTAGGTLAAFAVHVNGKASFTALGSNNFMQT